MQEEDLLQHTQISDANHVAFFAATSEPLASTTLTMGLVNRMSTITTTNLRVDMVHNITTTMVVGVANTRKWGCRVETWAHHQCSNFILS